MHNLPSLFVSHGAPTLALDDIAARRFLLDYGPALPRPQAILVISAHWETASPALTATPQPQTIHDFFGFPQPLYELRYPAPGNPALAARIADLLMTAGYQTTLDSQRGLDHGAWVPLLLLFPKANIPVLQLSLPSSYTPAQLLALGQALAPLRAEGVLIIGSGSVTHNLAAFGRYQRDDPPPAWVSGFADWLTHVVEDGRLEDLLDYRRHAPHAVRNHPTEEHFLPLFVALGAAGAAARGRCIHSSYAYGILAMDAYAFAPAA